MRALLAGWNTYGYVGGSPANRYDPLGLRDVIVSIWEDGVGHVQITEMDNTPILNQYPRAGSWHSQAWSENKTAPRDFSYRKTNPSSTFRVWISNDAAFDEAAKRARSKKFWTLIPSSDIETNCASAANDALQAG